MTDLENREAFEDWFAFNSMHDHVYVRGERMDDKGNYYSEYAYLAWSAWQAAKAMTDLSELQERIAGHQYYHGEHGYLIVDMDDVVKEIQELAND